MFNVIIIGTGAAAKLLHFPAWNRMKRVKVIGVCDTDLDKAANFAVSRKIPHFATNLIDLLSKIGTTNIPTIVDVCTPPNSHCAITKQALEMGFHVLLEKPMATNINDVNEIMNAYHQRKNKDIKMAIVQQRLTEPGIKRIRSLIDKTHDEILNVETRFLTHPKDREITDPTHWVHTLPGGYFGEGLIHPVYVLGHFLGTGMKIESLQAANRSGRHWLRYDELFITFSAKQKIGSIYVSFNAPRRSIPSTTVYGKKNIIKYEASNLCLRTLGKMPSYFSVMNFFIGPIDLLRQVFQMFSSLGEVLIKRVTGRLKTDHEIYFSAFVDSIEKKESFSYSLEEAFEATLVYLDALSRIEHLNDANKE